MTLVALVTGDRNWSDAEMIRDALIAYHPDYVIEGEARGADSLARDAARALHMCVIPYPAQWDRYGRSAGPRRNEQMLHRLESARAHGFDCIVLAFHPDLSQSKGTAHMYDIATTAGFAVRLYPAR